MEEINNKNNVRIVQLENYVQPEIKEYSGRNYVTFGRKNQFFQELIDRSRGSVTNGACISGISNLTYGKGLTSDEKDTKTLEWVQVMSMFKDDDVRKFVSDLKTTGQCAIQCQWRGGHKAIKTATHLPIETLVPEKVGEDDKIEAYYYAPDWNKVRTMADVTRIPVLGTSKEGIEILIIRPYQSGLFYFALPDWFSGFQWAELEEEISNYHLNNIKNAFAPSMFISLNNGQPESEEEATKIVNKMMNTYKGSQGTGKVIISFADNAETASTITPIPLSDASEQYQFLSDESAFKILSAHKIPSPLLLGIPTKTGFSSNAEELKTASILMESFVLNPLRNLLIDGFDKIMAFNKMTIDIYFDSLNPFAEEEKADITSTTEEEETKLSEEATEDYLESLGETISDDWTLIDERDVDYVTDEDFDSQVDEWNSDLNEVKLASTGTARPNANSEQDAKVKDLYFKVRYKYTGSESPDRDFCKKMMSADKLYRKEDIEQMSSKPVNAGFGEKGAATYDIFLYKGGARCEHKWLRQTFMSDMKSLDAKSPLAKRISTNQAESKYKYRVRNAKTVATKPADMPRKGFSPKNTNLPSDV